MVKNPGMTGISWDNGSSPGGATNTLRGLTHSLSISKEGLPDMVPKTCSIPECGKPLASRGMCHMHRAQKARSGSLQRLEIPSPHSRFESKTESGPACWEWIGATNNRGYGVFRLDGRTQLAHRAAWFFEHGDWPNPDRVLDHVCNNKTCVNPEHLRELMNWQNLRRAIPRGDVETERRRARWRRVDAERRGTYKYIPGGGSDLVV